MAELIPRINEDDAKVLIKKDRWWSPKPIKSVAAYNQKPTKYPITFGNSGKTWNLNQKE
jgi:hypothetical protein